MTETTKSRCDRAHVEDWEFSEECGHEGISDLLEAIEKRHIENSHGGAARFCEDDVCRAASEVSP